MKKNKGKNTYKNKRKDVSQNLTNQIDELQDICNEYHNLAKKLEVVITDLDLQWQRIGEGDPRKDIANSISNILDDCRDLYDDIPNIKTWMIRVNEAINSTKLDLIEVNE